MIISIMQGYVRVGTAGSWDEARKLLAEHVKSVYWGLPNQVGTADARDAELERVAGPIDQGYLWASRAGMPVNVCRYAVERDEPYGIGEGDLATVWDHSNGHAWWTIAVKVKVLEVGSTLATVRITGNSSQFTRGETRSVPLSFIRPRSKR